MTTGHRSERLDRGLASVDAATRARVAARVAARTATGEPAGPGRFRDDGPDPLNIGWAWAGGGLSVPMGPLASPSPGPTQALPGAGRKWQFFGYSAGAVLAASLLLALGMLLGQKGVNQPIALAAKVTARPGEVRGPGRVVDLTVENTSVRAAFVTVVGLRGARSPVYYETGKSFIRLGPDQASTFELPGRFDGLTDAVVVLTPSPAGEVVLKIVEEGALPDDPTAARGVVAAGLARFGFTDSAVETVRLTP